MFRSRLLWKLYIGYALLILLTTGIVGGLVALQIAQRAQAETDRRLEAEAILLRDIAANSVGTEAQEDLQGRVRSLGLRIGTRFTILASDGLVLADSEKYPRLADRHLERPELQLARDGVIGTATRYSQASGQRMRYLAMPFEGPNGRGWVRTSLPQTSIASRLTELRRAVLAGAAVAALIALGIGFLLARRLTRPVLSMAVAAESIAAGDYEKQVEIGSNDELGTLARAFNVMSRQLRSSMATINADRRKLTSILASMVEGVVAANRNERITHMNAACGRMLGIEPQNALSQPIWETIRVREVSEAVSEAMRREQVIHRVVRLPGSPDRILDLHASPLESTEGEITGVVLVLDDVTQLRRLETMRRDFLGNVSHELKTPVTAIRALVETVLDDAEMDSGTRQRFLGKVRNQAERMSNLVNDLLSLSRLESESEALEVEPIDLCLTVRDTLRELHGSRTTHGAAIRSELPEEPVVIPGDSESLRQAVGNLVNNAIKYAQSEHIVVRVVPDGEHVLIEVEDDGVGIELRHQERIFERFYRVDKARSREMGGTGLGLAIVKHIAAAHDGSVCLDSRPGSGSLFQIRLPRVRPLISDSQILRRDELTTAIS